MISYSRNKIICVLVLNVHPGGRGRGKRKFAPQGSWRQYSEGSYDDGAEVFAMLQRTKSVSFSSAAPAAASASGKGQAQAQILVEKAWEIWGGSDSTFSAEVIEGIYQNIKKSK